MTSLEAALQKRRDMESGIIWASEIPFESLQKGPGRGVRLFLGSGKNAQNLEQLLLHNVTHILNVADDVPNYHESYMDPAVKREADAKLLLEAEEKNKIITVEKNSTTQQNANANSHRQPKVKPQKLQRYFKYRRCDVKDFGGDAGISRVFDKSVEFIRSFCDAVDGSATVKAAATEAAVSSGVVESKGEETTSATESIKECHQNTSSETTETAVNVLSSGLIQNDPGNNSNTNSIATTKMNNIDSKNAENITTTTSNPTAASPSILVHCANGSNRSVSVVIAAMMILDEMSLRSAWEVVKAHRPSAMPFQDNRKELIKFERKLYPL